MTSSVNNLEAARSAWKAVPVALRGEVARALVDAALEKRGRERLADLLSQALALPRLAAPSARRKIDALLDKVCSPLFKTPADGTEPAFAGAYVRHLLALALPLAPDGVRSEVQSVRNLIERTHGHEVLAPLAFEAASRRLADELLKIAGDELLIRARELLAPGPVAGGPGRWVDRPGHLLLSVDHVTLSCARYLAGLQLPSRDRYGYDELRAGPAGRAKRVDKVTVKFDPSSVTYPRDSANPGEEASASELKAKLFVALFALAAQAKDQGAPTPTRVRLRDLLWMIGFELGRVTNSEYYWRYAAQLTRYLLIDLPSRVVAMQLSLAGDIEPRIVFEPLLERVLPLGRNGEPLPQDSRRQLYGALQGETTVGVDVRRFAVEGFEFAVSDELLAAHGVGKPLNAIEHVPVEVLSLKGPAFWLAWQVAFLRRWASLPTTGGSGKPLLKALEETGHLAVCTRAGKVRYKDALTSWWADSGELAAIGLLREPGVRLYGQRGGSWREISTEVSRWLDPGAGRLSRNRLQEVRVVFQIPPERFAKLEAARRRKRRSGGGATDNR